MTAATPAPVRQHVTSTPGVCGGRPRIDGTRIRVQDVYVWHELHRQSPDEIVTLFPQLTLADVYAAMAYFWDNRDQVLADVRDAEALAGELEAAQPSLPRRKLAGEGSAA